MHVTIQPMKILRYRDTNSQATFGWLNENKVGALLGNPFEHYRRLEPVTPLERIDLLPPLVPGKIIAIEKNYLFQGESTQSLPAIPSFYLKPPQSIIGTNQAIVLPRQSHNITAHAELAVVIGKPARWISTDQVYDHVMGYCCAATCVAKDLLELDGYAQNRAAFFDTFTSLGPWIETDLDPNDILISTFKNKSQTHMATTHDMLFSIPQLIVYLSTIMTLLPGDVILTGPIHQGIKLDVNDMIQVEIDGIGSLLNSVSREVSPKV